MGRERITTDEGLAHAPHRRDCGLAPLSYRLPLKGGVMDGHGSPSILIVILIENMAEERGGRYDGFKL